MTTYAPCRPVASRLLLCVLLVGLLLAGLGCGGSNTPAGLADRIMSMQKNKDWKGLYQLVTPKEKQTPEAEQFFVGMADGFGKLINIKDYQIGEVKENGDTATVKVTVTAEAMGQTSTKTEEMPFQRVDGQWRPADGSSPFGGMGGSGSSGGSDPFTTKPR